jgi:uncharacterized protein
VEKSIIDAGPIISLFDKDDRYHKPVLEFIKDNKLKLISTWPVVTEVTHMLTFNIAVQLDFLRWLSNGAIEIIDISIEKLDDIIKMMEKYSDIPMDLADASLIYISEEYKINKIITIDSEYYIYRTKNKKMLNNLLENYL